MYVTTSNKRQFYTMTQSDQNAINSNVNKNKFGSFSVYGTGNNRTNANNNMNNSLSDDYEGRDGALANQAHTNVEGNGNGIGYNIGNVNTNNDNNTREEDNTNKPNIKGQQYPPPNSSPSSITNFSKKSPINLNPKITSLISNQVNTNNKSISPNPRTPNKNNANNTNSTNKKIFSSINRNNNQNLSPSPHQQESGLSGVFAVTDGKDGRDGRVEVKRRNFMGSEDHGTSSREKEKASYVNNNDQIQNQRNLGRLMYSNNNNINKSASPFNKNSKIPQTSPNSNLNPHPIQTIKIQQKCIICQTPTEKCCSLCRRVFYCTPQHQQFDWHTKHKFVCQGKASVESQRYNTGGGQGHGHAHGQGSLDNNNKFVFYSNNPNQPQKTRAISNQPHSHYPHSQSQPTSHSIQKFLEFLQKRLVLRTKILTQASKLTQRSPLIVRQSLVKQTEQLLTLSLKITNQQYKPSFSRKITKKDIIEYSNQHWGSQVVISQVGVGLQLYADMVLMGKMYHLCSMGKEVREIIIGIGKMLEDADQVRMFLGVEGAGDAVGERNKKFSVGTVNYSSIISSQTPQQHSYNTHSQPHSTGIHQSSPIPITTYQIQDPHLKTKTLLLQSIIQLAQLYKIDKTTQSAYKIYIKKIEQQYGIWQQIYAYFNIGVWYMKKTYYDKSVKSFTYVLELLDGHKKNAMESVVFKGDCLYNLAEGYWRLGDRSKAIQCMQECYRARINGIGKNSMESSYCLYQLAKWYRQLQKWNQCLQYLDQCHRIRKLYQNQPIHQKKLQQIKTLISQIYQHIKQQKQKTLTTLQPSSQKYYQQLLSKQNEQQQRLMQKKENQSQLLPKGTVTSRLFRDDREYVKFKVVLSQEFWSTVTAEQAKFLAELLEMSDKKMEKGQAGRVLIESRFVSSLGPEQKQRFFRENQIQKIKEAVN